MLANAQLDIEIEPFESQSHRGVVLGALLRDRGGP